MKTAKEIIHDFYSQAEKNELHLYRTYGVRTKGEERFSLRYVLIHPTTLNVLLSDKEIFQRNFRFKDGQLYIHSLEVIKTHYIPEGEIQILGRLSKIED